MPFLYKYSVLCHNFSMLLSVKHCKNTDILYYQGLKFSNEAVPVCRHLVGAMV
jgi:hypothetical protein